VCAAHSTTHLNARVGVYTRSAGFPARIIELNSCIARGKQLLILIITFPAEETQTTHIWLAFTHKEPTKLINVANNLPQIIIIGNSSTPIYARTNHGGRRLKSNADRSWPSSRLNSDARARGRGKSCKARSPPPLQMCTASEMSNLGAARCAGSISAAAAQRPFRECRR
jgi:hypothetical protein